MVIEDNEEEMRRIAGKEYSERHLAGRRKSWDMPRLFEHIVLERMVLDMSPKGSGGMPAQQSRGGRRAAISMGGGEAVDLTASVISLKRDEETAVENASSFSPSMEEDQSSQSTAPEDAAPSGNRRCYWLRIHSRTHRMVGRPLRTVLLLRGEDPSLKAMEESPDQYFKSTAPIHCLAVATLCFKSKDALNKKTFELLVAGETFLQSLPPHYQIDLTTRFRRNKFGSFVTSFLTMRFLPRGEVELFLISSAPPPAAGVGESDERRASKEEETHEEINSVHQESTPLEASSDEVSHLDAP